MEKEDLIVPTSNENVENSKILENAYEIPGIQENITMDEHDEADNIVFPENMEADSDESLENFVV